jgi:hypothetical protein
MSVKQKILGAEARSLMGRVMAGDFLEGVGTYLHPVAARREEELSAAIRARAGELAEAGKDMIVDQPSAGALAIGAAVLASFETLLPLFDGDERPTVLYPQHVTGDVLTRPYELAFKTLSERNNPSTRSTRRAGERDRSTAPAGTSTTGARAGPVRDQHPALFLARFLRPSRRQAGRDRDVRVGHELDAGDRPGRERAARRTHLAALGDDRCPFAVLETDDPLAGYTDKIEQRFARRDPDHGGPGQPARGVDRWCSWWQRTVRRMNGENQRLREAYEGAAAWRRWGPYLSERQRGTVREDYVVLPARHGFLGCWHA